MTYLPSSDTAATGRYQVLLYDNNFGAAESYPKFDWGQLGAAVVTDADATASPKPAASLFER